MKERMGDGKLIIIIMTVRGINDRIRSVVFVCLPVSTLSFEPTDL